MVTALGLLVIALVSVLYHDRDFWFPEERQAEEHVPQTPPAIAQSRSGPIKHESFPAKMTHSKAQPVPQAAPDTRPAEDVPAVTATRTVLPPLEVEVIGGNASRRLRPGSNTVRIDLERGSSPSRATPAPADPEPLPATLTSNAAERVEVSSDAGDLVTHSVTPGYPMLARQMKVQGSVILLAIIGRDGLIQDLQVVSGSPILARAAQEAVKQWHFKPHYIGADPVETQAKITVNFTISTN